MKSNSSKKENKCPTCGGTGIYVKDEKAYKCRCVNEMVKNIRYENSQLPQKLQSVTFEDFDFKYFPEKQYPEGSKSKSYKQIAWHTFNAAKKFAFQNVNNAQGRGILFSGNVGSGKTFLSSAIANYLLQNGQSVLFVVVPDLLDRIRASYNKNSDFSELEILDRAGNVPVLILDDLGVHNYTEWAKNKIYSILNKRLNNEIPTVINSNLSLEEMEEHLGERTTSRIVEMCDIYRLIVPKDIRHIKNIERHS